MPVSMLPTDVLVHVLRYTTTAADLFSCLRTCHAFAQAAADDRCWVGLRSNGARKNEDRHGVVAVESHFGSHRERVCYRMALNGIIAEQKRSSSIIADILGKEAWLQLTSRIFKSVLEKPQEVSQEWQSIQCPSDLIRTQPGSDVQLCLGAAASGMLQTVVEDDAITFMEKGVLAAIHRNTGRISTQGPSIEPPVTTFNEHDAHISARIADDRGYLFNSHVDTLDVPMNLELMRRIARRAGVVKITHGALQLYWNRLVNTVAYVTLHAVVRLLELSKDSPCDDDDAASDSSASGASGASDGEDEDEDSSDEASSGGGSNEEESEDEEESENEPWIQKRETSSDDDLATMNQRELITIYSPPEAFLVAAVEQLRRDNSCIRQGCYGLSTAARSDAAADSDSDSEEA